MIHASPPTVSANNSPASAPDGAAELFASSPVVALVFEQILAAVHRGELLPGERISDAAIASQYGVSRTPVREALQRLREIGVIEASASRFTRVAIVTPEETAQSYIVWLALFSAIIDEVVPVAPLELATQLELDNQTFQTGMSTLDPLVMATANFAFFNSIQSMSKNGALLRAMNSVVHVIRLGGQRLPAYIDIESLSGAQLSMIEAVRNHDVELAHKALAVLRGISVPVD